MKKTLSLVLLTTNLLAMDVSQLPAGEEVDAEHVIGPCGSVIHKAYWDYLQSHKPTALSNPKHKILQPEDKELDLLCLPSLPVPKMKHAIWIKESWVDPLGRGYDGYYLDDETGYLYYKNGKNIPQDVAKDCKLSAYSTRPSTLVVKEVAQFMEELMHIYNIPVLIIVLDGKE